MSFTVTMSGVIVGRSDLETRNEADRIVSGVFRPGLGYDLAQPVFELYLGRDASPEALARYRKARDALQLQLTDSAGTLVTVRELYIRRESGPRLDARELILEIETDDPAMQGEMTIAMALADADGGTELVAVHDGLPPGIAAADNEAGWRDSLRTLAALVEVEP